MPPFFDLPILRRELVGLLRTRRAAWLLVLAVAGSALVPILAWPEGRDAADVTNVALLSWFLGAQLVLALIAAAAFAAPAITTERERETLDELRASLLSPASIVLSKALAASAFLLIAIAAAAPALCVLELIGGATLGSILRSYLVTAAAIAAATLVCLGQSMRSRKTTHAIVRGILWVLFWNVGLLFLIFILIRIDDVFRLRIIMQLLEAFVPESAVIGLSPFTAIASDLGILPIKDGQSAAWASVLFSSAIGAVELARLLRGASHLEAAPSRRRKASSTLRAPAVSRCILAQGILMLGEGGVPLARNPVFLKEIRSEHFAKIWYRRAAFWGPLGLFVAIVFILGREGIPNLLVAVSLPALALIVLVAAGFAATSFTREADQGNLDFLRGTRLTMGEILTGKLLASLYSGVGIAAAAAATVVVALLFRIDQLIYYSWESGYSAAFQVVTAVFPFFAALLVFSVAVALLASAVSTSSVASILVAYLAVGLASWWPVSTLLRGYEWWSTRYGFRSRVAGDLLRLAAIYGVAALVILAVTRRLLERYRARDR